jgi:hypothetical protein
MSENRPTIKPVKDASDFDNLWMPADHQTHLAFAIAVAYVLAMITDFSPAVLERAWANAPPGREAAERNSVLRALLATLERPSLARPGTAPSALNSHQRPPHEPPRGYAARHGRRPDQN